MEQYSLAVNWISWPSRYININKHAENNETQQNTWRHNSLDFNKQLGNTRQDWWL